MLQTRQAAHLSALELRRNLLSGDVVLQQYDGKGHVCRLRRHGVHCQDQHGGDEKRCVRRAAGGGGGRRVAPARRAGFEGQPGKGSPGDHGGYKLQS